MHGTVLLPADVSEYLSALVQSVNTAQLTRVPLYVVTHYMFVMYALVSARHCTTSS